MIRMSRELIVPIAIMGVLASLILPLPPVVIDFLLVGNIVLALVLLISTLYISNPLKLSSLPGILLLTTLYRLSLNVSTTRLILGHGDAGSVIEAFGSVVISGNIVVGAVVFLMITLIQFIVIAKGSERVAEVSARFTLDALPGKQMSIDADVRAGLIDFEEAGRKRRDLQTESRFYGALDGAMKFIKGDAIAGIVITLVNVVGGFAIGILINHLDFATALNKYTLLTIGDGLLSQIPALLNSLAAGMVVTRVSRGDDESLAVEVLSQIGQLKKVKLLIGTAAVLLGLMPGMPFLPFLSLALLLLLSGLLSGPDRQKDGNSEKQPQIFTPRTPPVLQVELPREAGQVLYQKGLLQLEMDRFRQRIYDQYGLILALPEFSAADQSGYRILMRGVEAVTKCLEGEPDVQSVIRDLEILVENRTSEFVDDILTRRTLDQFDQQAPELVSAVIPDIISVTQLTEILKSLLGEGITIRNFDMILQAVAEAESKAANPRVLLEEVRIALKRIISARFCTGGVVRAHTLEPVLDLAFERVEREGVAMDMDYLDLIAGNLKGRTEEGEVLMVSRGARRLIRDCLELRGMKIPVLAHEELVPEVKYEVVSLISLPGSEKTDELVEKFSNFN
jgi:type III secretory pathway component EscV